VPVINIVEIVQVAEWLPLHGALPGCLGNIVHRNTLLPVFDSTVLGTDGPGEPIRPTTVIVVTRGDTVFGLAIDRYLTVLPLDTHAEVQPTDPHTPGNTSAVSCRKPFVETVYGYRNNTLIMLSVAAISDTVKRLFSHQMVLAEDGKNALARGAPAAEAVRHSFMCARIERVVLGIAVEKVLEVIEDYDVTPLFKVPSCLRGLMNLRGQVLACIDISQELGFPLRKLEEHNQFIVLQGDGTELALCVDEILDIRLLSHHRFQKAETVLSGEITRYVHHVLATQDGTIVILSVPDMFDSSHLQSYQRPEV
jgi:purine-binding chemotaxis protein CheW